MERSRRGAWLDRVILPLRKGRILWRLIILYAVVCAAPILIFGGLYRARYTAELRQKLGSDALRLLSMLTDRQNDLLENMERITMKLSTTDEVQRMLTEPSLDPYAKNQLALQITRQIEQNLLISPLAKNVTLLDTGGRVVYSMGYDRLQDAALRELVPRAEDAYPLELVTSLPSGGQANMVMVRAINQADFTGQRLGYLLLVVDEERFAQETCRQVYPEEQGQVVLVGADGTVISSADPALASGLPLPDPSLLETIGSLHAAGDPHFSIEVGGQSYYASFFYNSKARWYALALVREGYMNAEMDRLNAFILLVSFLCLGLGLVAMLVIAASIVRPVNRLVRYCRGVAARTGERSIRDGGRDEIGYLTGEVGRMVARLDEYGEREVQNSIQMKNLEIQMLQAQINPHFLFNTLNSIKWTAVLSRVPAVADSLSALAGLLKNTIVNKQEFLPLQGELENIRNYALIQSLRYTEQFVMEYRVDDACLETPILKFLLQPIVENAILHGVEGVGRLVTITVEARPWQGGLEVTVRDDGAGFDTALPELQTTSSRRFSGIGMGNVRQRVALVYGPAASMTVESEPGRGTAVTLLLPPKNEEERPDV